MCKVVAKLIMQEMKDDLKGKHDIYRYIHTEL